jgi:IclR family pca regulon transcriptional regulator
MPAETDKTFVSALAKGIRVLNVVADSTAPDRITQLSKGLHWSIGAVQRVTSTLTKLGYLRRPTTGQGYILGPKAWGLGLSIVNQIELKAVVHPYLKDLSDKVGETVNLGVLDGTEMIYLDRIKTNHILNLNVNVGARLPAYSTSLGKAIAAFLPEPELKEFLGRLDLRPLTPHTITRRKILEEELRRTRKKGFAINNAETDNGIRSVAAPLRDRSGRVIAAINISVPSIRVTREELQGNLAREVTRAAQIISEALGHRVIEGAVNSPCSSIAATRSEARNSKRNHTDENSR